MFLPKPVSASPIDALSLIQPRAVASDGNVQFTTRLRTVDVTRAITAKSTKREDERLGQADVFGLATGSLEDEQPGGARVVLDEDPLRVLRLLDLRVSGLPILSSRQCRA